MRKSITVKVPSPETFGTDNDRFMAKCDEIVKAAIPPGSKIQSMNINTFTYFVAEAVYDDGTPDPAKIAQEEQEKAALAAQTSETHDRQESGDSGISDKPVKIEKITRGQEADRPIRSDVEALDDQDAE